MSQDRLILATTAAIALGGFEMRRAAAARKGGPVIVKQNAGADDFGRSEAPAWRGPGRSACAMGALSGRSAAAAREREYYERPYYGRIWILRGPAGLLYAAAAVCASLCAAASVLPRAPLRVFHPDRSSAVRAGRAGLSAPRPSRANDGRL